MNDRIAIEIFERSLRVSRRNTKEDLEDRSGDAFGVGDTQHAHGVACASRAVDACFAGRAAAAAAARSVELEEIEGGCIFSRKLLRGSRDAYTRRACATASWRVHAFSARTK